MTDANDKRARWWTALTLGAFIAPTVPSPIGLVTAVHAQAPSSAVQFETASIKANHSGDTRQSSRLEPGGRYAATNIQAKHLIRLGYGLQDFQIVGAPGWMESERFDVVAKAPADATRDAMQAMMQRLLADRFDFKAHTEIRRLPMYALAVARIDGRRGPALRDASPCTPAGASSTANAAPPCNFTLGDGRLAGRSVTMARLASELQGLIGAVVVDQTMLTAPYDVSLEWTPDLHGVGSSASAPSLFTALQEQLGLKLMSTKGPVNMLVVDRVARPTQD